jgi:hypothetical protein
VETITKYVYDPIEHGYVKKELDKQNIKDDGKRRARFHQWLSDNGRNILITPDWERPDAYGNVCRYKQV